MVRRAAVSVGILCLLTVAVIGLRLGRPAEEAQAASLELSKAVTVINSDVAWNLKLIEFEAIRKEGGSAAITALVKLTESEDARVQTLACTTLGRMKTEASKAELKKLAKSTKAKALRIAATCALARQGTSTDRSWIDSSLATDATVGGQVALLKKATFWK
jgi:HEAT repeat protein